MSETYATQEHAAYEVRSTNRDRFMLSVQTGVAIGEIQKRLVVKEPTIYNERIRQPCIRRETVCD